MSACQKVMSHGSTGALRAASACNPLVEGGKRRAFGARRRPAGFGEYALQPAVTWSRFAAHSLAAALPVPWAHAGPRGQMGGRRKVAHVQADFGHDDFGNPFANSGKFTQ